MRKKFSPALDHLEIEGLVISAGVNVNKCTANVKYLKGERNNSVWGGWDGHLGSQYWGTETKKLKCLQMPGKRVSN